MLGAGWFILRQADEAIENGDWDEAARLLSQPEIRRNRRTRHLSRRLARARVERGERMLASGDTLAAWRELVQSEQLCHDSATTASLRRKLTQMGLNEMREMLATGRPVCAAECAARLRESSMRHPDLEALEQTADRWARASESADRGEFGHCLSMLDQMPAADIRIDKAMQTFRRDVDCRRASFTEKSTALMQAAQKKNWPEVLQNAEEVLAVAPKHVEAQHLRTKAWRALEPENTMVRTQSYHPTPKQPRKTAERKPAGQFLLWIDGVGGYLVCMNNEIRIGQAVSESPVDIPIFADISRHHATIHRDNEGYVIQAFRKTQVNCKDVEKTLLQNNDRVTLGNSCQFRFLQTVPVSSSARLEMTSGHRLRHAVDGILLMADTLVLGPGTQAHVTLPYSVKQIVFFRVNNELSLRYSGSMRINGRPVQEKCVVEAGAAIAGDDFSLAIEPVL